MTEIESIGFLRLRLYLLYDEDQELLEMLDKMRANWWGRFGPQLRRLADCLPDLDDAEQLLAGRLGSDHGVRYLEDLGKLASQAGLDRIPAVGMPPEPRFGYLPSGRAQAHRFMWQMDKYLLWEAAPTLAVIQSPPVRRPTFVRLASFGTAVPAVDGKITGTGARWDPRKETRAEAHRRLRVETRLSADAIEAELERIARQGGYRFPDSSTSRGGIYRMDRDAQWVWWRLRRRWTYGQIAREWNALHPGDIRLQIQAHEHPADGDEPGDEIARQWEADHPSDMGMTANPDDAIQQVRKAVATFGQRARIHVTTGPGRRASRA